MSTIRTVLFIAIVLVCAYPAAAFPIVPRAILKTYFQTGDIPTQDEFFSLTSPTGDVSPLDPPDIHFLRGSGSTHFMQGLGGTEFLTDGNGHPLFLSVGDRPTSGQFSTLLDSSVNIIEDRYLIGLRFTRSDGVHFGFIDFSIDSPLPGYPGVFGLTIHGWAYESEPNTPITVFSIPTPGAAALLGLSATATMRRRRPR